jgi:very-short-patch-repair endonuclease
MSTSYWKGKKLPIETRKKMSDTHKKLVKQGIVPPSWLGKSRGPQTAEHKAKTVKNLIMPQKGEKHFNWKGGKPICIDCGKRTVSRSAKRCWICARKHLLEGHPTSIEVKLYQELKNRGFLIETQKLINGKFTVDAYIPSLNFIVEADGDYWHSMPKVARKDKSENAYLTKCGFGLLRLSGTEINDGSFKNRLEELN